jgi:hypothetical protein
MKVAASFEDGRERWSLRDALRHKAGWNRSQIDEALSSADLLDRIEMAMELEAEFGIEILDEELKNASVDALSDELES